MKNQTSIRIQKQSKEIQKQKDIPRQPNGILVSTVCFSITDKHYQI